MSEHRDTVTGFGNHSVSERHKKTSQPRIGIFSPIDNGKTSPSGKAELSHSFPRVQLNRVSGSPVCSMRLREAIP